jgi:hypothetical protein
MTYMSMQNCNGGFEVKLFVNQLLNPNQIEFPWLDRYEKEYETLKNIKTAQAISDYLTKQQLEKLSAAIVPTSGARALISLECATGKQNQEIASILTC